MSLYNMMFGVNRQSDVILATLGLSRDTVGRFRDCYVSDGKIAVYTRNGGGNRDCVCAGYEEYGLASCKNAPYSKEVAETEERPGMASECECGSRITIGTGHRHYTGNTVTEEWYRCLAPCSEECGCCGCTIQFRLPKHPNYLSDEDDEFDSTYATIYFSFPQEYEEGLKALDTNEPWNPGVCWEALFQNLEGVNNG